MSQETEGGRGKRWTEAELAADTKRDGGGRGMQTSSGELHLTLNFSLSAARLILVCLAGHTWKHKTSASVQGPVCTLTGLELNRKYMFVFNNAMSLKSD